MARDLEADLDGAGVQNELFDVGRLSLPSQSANATVLEAADPPLRLGRSFRLALGNCLDGRVGNGVDQPETEERRRVSLRPCDSELANRKGALSERRVARQEGRPDLHHSRLDPAVN
jgi:hypothetical protein